MEILQFHINEVMYLPRWKNAEGRRTIQQHAKIFGLKANRPTKELLEELEYDVVSTDQEWMGMIRELVEVFETRETMEQKIETLDTINFFVTNTPYKLTLHSNIRDAIIAMLERNKTMYPNYEYYRSQISDKKLV
jgi:hypothetical protein